MGVRPRTVLLIALAAAFVVFCVVQDRVTAGAARQYVDLQRAAASGAGRPVSVDDVMRPGVRRSVGRAALWGAAVMGAGAVAAAALRRMGA